MVDDMGLDMGEYRLPRPPAAICRHGYHDTIVGDHREDGGGGGGDGDIWTLNSGTTLLLELSVCVWRSFVSTWTNLPQIPVQLFSLRY